MLRVVQPQSASDEAVARAMGGASPFPSSKVFLQSLTACVVDKLSSLSDFVTAGTETREMEAMVPGET